MDSHVERLETIMGNFIKHNEKESLAGTIKIVNLANGSTEDPISAYGVLTPNYTVSTSSMPTASL